MTRKNFETGDQGEQAVAEILRGRGYSVKPGPPGGCDLILNDLLTVEVKTANLSGRTGRKTKCWQFVLFCHPEDQKPFEEDLLILRCLSEPPCHFVIPGWLVDGSLTKIDITSSNPWAYGGKWAFFRERWLMVDKVMGVLHAQQ